MERRKTQHIGYAAWLLMLCGCQAEGPVLEEPSTVPQQSLAIEVIGGKPDGLALSSRAVSEPSKFGQCNADKLQLWVYRGYSAAAGVGGVVSEDRVTEFKDHQELSISRYSEGFYDDNQQKNSVDKVTSTVITASLRDNHKTLYIIPAIAYSEDDLEGNGTNPNKFDIITQEDIAGGKTETLSHKELNVKLRYQSADSEIHTPELYFGRLKLEVTRGDKSIVNKESGDLITVIDDQAGWAGSDTDYHDSPIYGKLYRIVSQLNINVTEVDVSSIERMELYVSNVPTSITLYGSHGEYYPVAAAQTEDEHEYATLRKPVPENEDDYEYDYIMVASTDNFPKVDNTYTATLSTFLLPSTEGRKVRVRLHYKPGLLTDDNGDALARQYIDYDIRPEKSHLLTGDDAEVYFKGAPANLKNGNNLYVYNHNRDEFYSYSNVKVNINGKFKNVFLENQPVDVQIEVCPSFEASHPFEFF